MRKWTPHVIIVVLLVFNIVGCLKKSDNVPNYEFLRSAHSEIREEIRELQTKIIEYDTDIFRIKRAIITKDSVIDNADSDALDGMFDDFFNRTRRQPPMLHSRRVKNLIEIR